MPPTAEMEPLHSAALMELSRAGSEATQPKQRESVSSLGRCFRLRFFTSGLELAVSEFFSGRARLCEQRGRPEDSEGPAAFGCSTRWPDIISEYQYL